MNFPEYIDVKKNNLFLLNNSFDFMCWIKNAEKRKIFT